MPNRQPLFGTPAIRVTITIWQHEGFRFGISKLKGARGSDMTENDVRCIRQICALISDETFAEFGGDRGHIRQSMENILDACERHRASDRTHIPISVDLTVFHVMPNHSVARRGKGDL